jgi:hypothetical protein
VNSKMIDWIAPEGLAQIESWARDGLTLDQIAHNCGCAGSTLREWKKKDPAVSAALKRGREAADCLVENALYKRATGYEYDEVTLSRKGDGKMKETKRVHKTALPDITAIIYWLKNRCPDKWQDRRNTNDETDNEIVVRFEGKAIEEAGQ